MSLQTRIQDLATRIATEFKTIRTLITGSATGDLSGLSTTDKSSLVAAVNEVLAAIGSAGGGDMLASIFDPQGIGADAFARANHTGTQPASTISDFATAVAALSVVTNKLVASNNLSDLGDAAAARGNLAVSSTVEMNAAITAAITTALEGEDLSDLAQDIADLQLTDAGLLNTNAAQAFTSLQLQQGQDNLQVYSRTQIGDPETNFVTGFEAGLV